MAKAKSKKAVKAPETIPAVSPQANPVAIIGAIAAGIALIRDLVPILRGQVAGGQVTASDQQKLADEMEQLRDESGDFTFDGDEWKPSGR
jgi:hypothetical protein